MRYFPTEVSRDPLLNATNLFLASALAGPPELIGSRLTGFPCHYSKFLVHTLHGANIIDYWWANWLSAFTQPVE